MTDKVKYYQLHDRNTGAVIHPETSARQVLMPGGTNLDEAFTGLTGTVKGKQNQLADSADVTISTPDGVPPHLSLTDRAKRAVFDDLFLAAAGPWGTIDHTHFNEDGKPSPYYLNELWLTYEEAVAVMDWGAITSRDATGRYWNAQIRTNLPPRVTSFYYGSTAPLMQWQNLIYGSGIEILNLSMVKTGTYDSSFCLGNDWMEYSAFLNSSKLRKVIGRIDIGKASKNFRLGSLPELTDIQLYLARYNMNLSGAPKLNATSIRYLVNSRHPENTAFTVSLHADVYNKIVEAAEGEKASEWSGLLELAASKNITFASA